MNTRKCFSIRTMSDAPELVLYVVRSDEARSTKSALVALQEALPHLNEGGVTVFIVPITPSSMSSPDVRDELADFGVERLPALVDPRKPAGTPPMAEGSRNVCNTWGFIVESLRARKGGEAAAARKQRATATKTPSEYHDWVAKNIGTSNEDNEEEAGDAMAQSAMRSRMQNFMERRKQLGMSAPGAAAEAANFDGGDSEVPRASRRPAKKKGAQKKPRGDMVASGSGGDVMRSVKKSAAKMDAADAMMAAALFGNRETT